MKKLLTLCLFSLATAFTTRAQMPYNVSVLQQAYQPLTAANTISSGIWDDTTYVLPLGFNFKIGSNTYNTLYLVNTAFGAKLTTASSGTASVFLMHEADMLDRGALTLTPKSPVRYSITGATGSRILKVEMFNAGFYNEFDINMTLNDSLNMQYWVYEGTDVVEMHYGPSRITNPTDYFLIGNGPLSAYITDFDLDIDEPSTTAKAYYMTGNPATPTLDSADNSTTTINVLSAYPASGTVYRFTPKTNPTTGVTPASSLAGLRVYPTAVANELHVDYMANEPVSYRILSLSGAAVQQEGGLHTGANVLQLGNLPAGVYQLQLVTGGAVSNHRFVKQ